MSTPIRDALKFGQSIWYDNIRRGLITSGELQGMVEEDGLMGVTSNPSIFEKAMAGSVDYDQAIKALVAQGVGAAQDLYERLAIEDIQLAADVLYPVWRHTGGRDGYVSFEVAPYLAYDTEGTIKEALRLHAAVGRENLMMKVPATPQGMGAISELISRGINVNVTLLFAIEAYEAAANAYLSGLEALAARGGEPGKVSSVASFFVSRIDSLIDDWIERALAAPGDAERREQLQGLLGKVAIANAVLAYGRYRDLCASPRWKALAARGARPQRVLWASTSTKNPRYPKTMYVDALIGADTVNTIPDETYREFRAHGRPRESLTENWAEHLEQARATIALLGELGMPLKQATDQLLAEGVKKFRDPFDQLLATIESKREQLLGARLDRLTHALGGAEAALKATLEEWRAGGKVRRLWNGDGSLWSGRDEDRWLGWLHVVENQRAQEARFRRIAEDVRQAGFKHVLLLGMGGSSLCPDVVQRTFWPIAGFPQMLVLDSTVPAQVRATAARIDPAATLFIVSSKSGTTTEPNVFKQYFFELAGKAVGRARAGARFVAITDPGTKLQQLAEKEGFRSVCFGVPSIGGRYSALSNFGMIPAAAMGLDVPGFLDSAEAMVQACAACVPPEVNPGVVLGAIMGTLARAGRDKVTIVAAPGIDSLGGWLEQLLAESTGKQGTGLIPVADESPGPPEVYGADRLFVQMRLRAAPAPDQDRAMEALEKAGHPVVRITLEDKIELGQEFFRWEIATAVAGSLLGINAFDQPDVEASKVATRKLTEVYEQTGALPAETPMLREDGISLFADPNNASALAGAAGAGGLAGHLAAHLARIGPGDYFAINAYVEMNEANQQQLQALRHAVRDARRVATTLGFGPRFLHSTGQLHKGGPNRGVFLQITSDDAEDLAIPGQEYTFGVLKRAQAQGDFEVLAERGRRLLRVHLGPDVHRGLARLGEMVRKALA